MGLGGGMHSTECPSSFYVFLQVVIVFVLSGLHGPHLIGQKYSCEKKIYKIALFTFEFGAVAVEYEDCSLFLSAKVNRE